MVNIDYVTSFLTSCFKDSPMTAEQIEQKIRTIFSVINIQHFREPENMTIRFSFGRPQDPETNFNDWDESDCYTLSELPEERKTMTYSIYDIWYDDGDDDEKLACIEVMLF